MNYTKLWEAFIGGEYGTATPVEGDLSSEQWQERTREFYEQGLGPLFFGEDSAFGTDESVGGYFASFDPVAMENAERRFRSAIGDPYVRGEDPFAWEKLSRYDITEGATSDAQKLLEDRLYGEGSTLGGQVGSTYGLGMAKSLEEYTTGLAGEREQLTYGELTSGASLASGRSGEVLRSGSAILTAEEELEEAYKNVRDLGDSQILAREIQEDALQTDLSDALTTYLDEIDAEKQQWEQQLMFDVQMFDPTGEGAQYADPASIEGVLSEGNVEWGCGYGLEWDSSANNGEGGCVTASGFQEDMGTRRVSETGELIACGIGEIWDDEQGRCVLMEELELSGDAYGDVCQPSQIGCDGVCFSGAVEDECGVCGGDGSTCAPDSEPADCAGIPGGNTVVDECGVCGGNGPLGGYNCEGDPIDDSGNLVDCSGECTHFTDCGPGQYCATTSSPWYCNTCQNTGTGGGDEIQEGAPWVGSGIMPKDHSPGHGANPWDPDYTGPGMPDTGDCEPFC